MTHPTGGIHPRLSTGGYRDPIYMNMPPGIKIKEGNRKTHELKLKNNLYGQKQGSRIWYLYLTIKLKELNFKQSTFDECIFTRRNLLFFFCVNDGVFLCPDKTKVDEAIEELRQAKLDIEDQGDIINYHGINLTYQKNGTIIMSQSQLIDQIIKDINLTPTSHLPSTPALATNLLQHEEKPPV